MFLVIIKQFWLVLILVTCANAAIWWHRGAPYREADPGLEAGYRRLVKGFILWGSLPWVVMGLGILLSDAGSTFAYFDAQSRDAFVWVFYASLIVVWSAGTWWIVLGDGAEELIRHPGLSNVPASEAWMVKAVWLLGIASGVIGFLFLFLYPMEMPPAWL